MDVLITRTRAVNEITLSVAHIPYGSLHCFIRLDWTLNAKLNLQCPIFEREEGKQYSP